MKTKISNLGNVLSKKQLTNIHGSQLFIITSRECSSICATASSGTRCFAGGTHCPGACDGRGGWWLY